MADQGGKQSGAERRGYAPPPTLTEVIAAKERELGIDDANQALDPEAKAARLVTAYSSLATPIGQAVKDAREVQWVVKNMIARGGLYLLAGNPKRARKSLLCLEMCLAVARGRTFLGMPATANKAIFANFEDGYIRCARRLKQLGVPDDAPFNVDLIASRGGFGLLCTYIKWQRPPFVVLDPMVEIELLMGVRDENRSDQIANMLADLRDLAREANTALLAPHHLARAGQNVRGSTAFEGSVDGWLIVRTSKDGVYTLESTNRDAPDMTIPFALEFGEGYVKVSATAPPIVGPIPEFSMKKSNGAGGKKSPGRPAGTTDDMARNALLQALANSTDGLGWDDRRAATNVGADRFRAIQAGLVRDGLAEQRGRKMYLTPKGTLEAKKSEPQPVDEFTNTPPTS